MLRGKKSHLKNVFMLCVEGSVLGSYQEFLIISYCWCKQFMFLTVKAAISAHLKNLETEFSTA